MVGNSTWNNYRSAKFSTKYMYKNVFWPYLDQFLTIFDNSETEKYVNVCMSEVPYMMG